MFLRSLASNFSLSGFALNSNDIDLFWLDAMMQVSSDNRIVLNG